LLGLVSAIFLGSEFCRTYDQEHIQQVESFKYIGSLENKQNSTEEEIKERILMGNKAFHVNAALFTSKLISKSAKLKLYNSVIKPVVTYACETWVLREYSKEKLLAFERKILRKMYAPFKEIDNT
jgi:hypothetical protein